MALRWVSKPQQSGPPLYTMNLRLTYSCIGEQALVGFEHAIARMKFERDTARPRTRSNIVLFPF